MSEEKKLGSDMKIPQEEMNRIKTEKEKALMLSEIKYHAKSICRTVDNLKIADPSYSDSSVKELIKFLMTRHGNLDLLDDVVSYAESLQENFFEKIVEGINDE